MRYPWYVRDEDKFLMTALVPSALATWRASVTYHKALRTINKKLNHRRHLEQSFDLLRTAWAKSNEPLMAAVTA